MARLARAEVEGGLYHVITRGAITDAARQKYAGMEGDDATGMSHTLWRQYDSFAGRWTAPDPYGGSMSVASPQSFNRYSYVNNDPR
jgi:RHS repeat-associated protein